MTKTVNLMRAHAIRYCATKPVQHVYMSVDDFIPIERNPHQRCEQLRTNKAHLRALVPTHWSVEMAITKDGSLYKLNGHTRALMWEKSKLERPEYLNVTVYSYKTVEEVTAAYEHFDNDIAAKKGSDTLQSGAHKAGIEFKTKWLKEGKYSAMLTEACVIAGISKKDTLKIDRVGKFKKELELFDTIPDLDKDKFVIGFGAGALVALRKYGRGAVPFITAFNCGHGMNNLGKKDAVQFLLEYLAERRAAGQLTGKANNIADIAFFLSCVERHKMGDPKLTRRPRPVDLKTYLPVVSKPTFRGRRGSFAPMSPVALAA